MSLKTFWQPTILAFGISAAALLWAAQPAPAAARDDLPYPWCAVKGDPECIFMTFQQCEESVNWHGLCETNPYLAQPDNEATRRGHAR